ncbi:MAG: type II secretion system F family protein [Pseudomonadota bacterium]
MFDQQTITLAVAVLAALSVSGLAYALLSPLMDRQDRKERLDKVAIADRRAARAGMASAEEAANRRKNIASKVKQQQDLIEAQQKKKKANTRAPLETRLQRAGLKWSKRTYFIVSAVMGVLLYGFCVSVGAPVYASLAGGVVGALAAPSWYVSFKTTSRMKRFLEEYPNAIDVIVRGMKAGLPLNDCMNIIAHEAAEPVGSEFKLVVEQRQLGLQLHEAIAKLYERMPLAEVNFLAIMMAIQGQSGGNLSEPLANLSKVVRERRKMKAKITAMSTEAKSSAAIIACLPVAVMVILYFSSPEYVSLLFSERLGHLLLGACVVLMLTGVLIMRKMINFDF